MDRLVSFLVKYVLSVGEFIPNDIFYSEGVGPQILIDAHSLLSLSGDMLHQFPWENSLSGGGQGRAPQPPCKRRGSQDRARREKIVIPQTPKPPKPPKGGK